MAGRWAMRSRAPGSPCAEAGGGQTWAAYQCYGDPGFVVRGHRPTVDLAGPDPVSDTDLVARLDTLAVRTGDLGLAGRGPVSDGHARLSAVWKALRDWVVQREGAADETVCRRLGAIARDLGDFRAAADHFGALVVERGDGPPRVGLLTRTTLPADLQQAANCLARAAQREARRRRRRLRRRRRRSRTGDGDRPGRRRRPPGG